MIIARYVLTIKLNEDTGKRYNARYEAGGHFNIMKDYLVHGSQAVQFVSVRILLVIEKENRFRIWAVDVKLAYLLSEKHLIRNIFIQMLHLNFIYHLKNV